MKVFKKCFPGILCLLFIALTACSGGPVFFSDVLDGNIPLDEKEKKAIQLLLTDSGTPPTKMKVYSDYSKYASEPGFIKICIQNQNVSALMMRQTNLKNMSPVSALPLLKELELNWNKLTGISGIADLKKLEILILSGNRLTHTGNLNMCTALTSLKLDNNELSTFPDISAMPDLQTLDLSDNEIESMQGFHRSNSITWLSLAGNKLKDTAGLDSMKRLYILLLERNFISSMDGLFNLPKLQTLFMQKNKLVKVGDLSNFHSLQHTNFSDNKIPEPPKKPAPDTTVPKKSPTGASAAETAAEQDPNMVPGHVASSNPPETTTLPKCKKTIADSYHYKKHSQGFSNTFEASRTKIKIDRTSGVRMLPNAFNGNFAFLVCTVKSGRVRVYLKAPNIFRFKKDKYGQKKMDSQRSKNFVYGVAEPGSPCKIRGGLMCMPDSVHQVILEPLEGPASGITVKISSKEINTRRP